MKGYSLCLHTGAIGSKQRRMSILASIEESTVAECRESKGFAESTRALQPQGQDFSHKSVKVGSGSQERPLCSC